MHIKENRIAKNQYIVFSVIVAFLSTAALSVSGEYVVKTTFLEIINAEMNGISIGSLIVFFALCVFYYKVRTIFFDIRHWSIPVIAILFSGFMLIGLSFTQNGNLDFIFGSKKQFCVAVLTFAGYLCLFEAVIKILYVLLDNRTCIKNKDEKKQGKVCTFVQKHAFFSSFAIIFIFWLPWLAAYLPGSVPYDGAKALLQSAGEYYLTDQHGWALVLLMGVLLRLGQHVSDNFGAVLILALFVLFELVCYATACARVRRWKLPSWVYPVMIGFFSIYPYFGTYAQTIIKDSPFMAAFVLYMVLYIDVCLLCRDKVEVKNYAKSIRLEMIALLFVGYLVCMIRNNGPYLVLSASLLLIIVINKGFRRYAVMLLIGAFSLVWVHGNVLAPAAGVTSITDRAKLYMTFQIAGRYMQVCPDDLTGEEKKQLRAVFYQIDGISELGELYDPELVDPIKSHYRTSSTEEELDDYLDVIYSMIKKHPKVCLEAVLNQSFGYYYPFYHGEVMSTYQFYITNLTTDTFDGFDIHYIVPYSIRQVLADYAELWQTLPVLSLLVNPAFPTWAMFLLVGYLAYRKKWREILVFAAPAANMAICMLSPVNGLPRYAMPSLACIPVLVIWTVLVTREEKDVGQQGRKQLEKSAKTDLSAETEKETE